MSQRHLDRLSPVDAAFLHLEEGGAHMHIGGLAIMDGPPPATEELLSHVGRRLHLVPRYRQRLAYPPLNSGRPVWVDDACFNLGYHVRHTAVPAPGSEDQLRALVGRIMSQRLDRTKPLWELWLVEGLADGRFAFISKTHHAVIDGVGGVDLMSMMFDLSPEGTPVDPPEWTPGEQPSGIRLATRLATDLAGNARTAVTGAVGLATSPPRLLRQARDVVGAATEAVRTIARSAPPTPLNVRPGPHRRWLPVRQQLADVRAVKEAFGGTVNDVVLTVVATALGRFLRARGEATDGLVLRACVPVSIRAPERQGAAGNEITMMVAPLPVGEMDPVDRLASVSDGMRRLKESKQALSARLLTQMEYFAPPTVLAQASRLGFSSRLYNLLVTNVPGPQFPVYMMGRRLREVFPVAFLAPEHAVAVAILSYDGALNFGVIADYDAVPDVELFAKEVDAALAELLARARGRGGRAGAGG